MTVTRCRGCAAFHCRTRPRREPVSSFPVANVIGPVTLRPARGALPCGTAPDRGAAGTEQPAARKHAARAALAIAEPRLAARLGRLGACLRPGRHRPGRRRPPVPRRRRVYGYVLYTAVNYASTFCFRRQDTRWLVAAGTYLRV